MKKFVLILLLTALPLLPIPGFGQGPAYDNAPAGLTIAEAYRKAEANYPLVKRYDLIRQTADYNLQNASRGYLPQLGLSAKATWQTDVTRIPVSIPGYEIPTLRKDQYQAVAELNQLIWDGGAIKAQREGFEAQAETDRAQYEVDLYALRERVNDIYFGVLLLDRQLELNSLFQEDLLSQFEKVSGYMLNGVANESDLDAVRVEQVNARQQRVDLEASRRAYIEMLGILMGENLPEDTRLEIPPYALGVYGQALGAGRYTPAGIGGLREVPAQDTRNVAERGNSSHPGNRPDALTDIAESNGPDRPYGEASGTTDGNGPGRPDARAPGRCSGCRNGSAYPGTMPALSAGEPYAPYGGANAGNLSGAYSVDRPELAVFDAQAAQLDAQRGTLRAATRPRFDFFVQGGYGNPGLNMLKDGFTPYAIGGLRFTWNFGNYYTKRNDLAKLDVSRREIEVQRETFLFNLSLQTTQKEQELAKYRAIAEDDLRLIQLRENIRRAAEVKTENGTMTVLDLMREVIAEQNARVNKSVHEIEHLKSWYELNNLLNN